MFFQKQKLFHDISLKNYLNSVYETKRNETNQGHKKKMMKLSLAK